MKWPWTRDSGPAAPGGTEANPITRGSRQQHPVKYQCHGCDRWWVEPEIDLMMRDRGERYSSVLNWLYQPLCVDCAASAVQADWQRYTKESEHKWKVLLHE